MKIGVIADTHDHFDPKIRTIFEGVEHILHAGDIGLPWIIMELEAIAPVTAVLGNTDVGLDFKETEVIRLAGRKFLVHHIVDVHHPGEKVQRRIEKGKKPDVAGSGHLHKGHSSMVSAPRFNFNPGYAGQPRFGYPRSVAILHCDETEMRAEYRDL